MEPVYKSVFQALYKVWYSQEIGYGTRREQGIVLPGNKVWYSQGIR